jgi:hypothetical protein
VTLRQAQGDRVRFTAPLRIWRGEGHGGYGYVVIGDASAEAIRAHELMRRLEFGKRRGFGSVKVTARIGESEWRSSVFPQKTGGWVLLVKKAIQRAEDLAEGEPVTCELELH